MVRFLLPACGGGRNALAGALPLRMPPETAQRADVIFPAASAYEKNGTVTNVCGEVQQLKAGLKVMGAKSDLEIFHRSIVIPKQ